MIEEREITHFHFCCGLGGAALGFNRGRAELNGMRGKFRCIGGVDNNPAVIRDFTARTGTRGMVLDLFDRQQYVEFHGEQPPADWREATPADVRRAAGNERPNIVFISAPCKGFSGLLSQTRSLEKKYQALNRLALRCIWLMCEAWSDDPPELIIFENVPRIATRGRALLDRMSAVLNGYGYATAETFHDCGEIGWLAQSRKRFLMVARHVAKVPAFLYEPPKRILRPVGAILDQLPLPGDMRGGPMHSVPRLQWKTWVRLAFVEAGSDWRSLNKLRVVDGKLADYLLMPEGLWEGSGPLGVNTWTEPAGTITADARPQKGAFSVADPRYAGHHEYAGYGVRGWDQSLGTLTSHRSPGQGPFSVADPRCANYAPGAYLNKLHVAEWDKATKTVTAGKHVQSGGLSVADPRINGVRHNNVFRIVAWGEASPSVTAGGHPTAGGINVADPRPGWNRHTNNLTVENWDEPSKTIIGGGKGVQGGWLSVADPRWPNSQGEHTSKYQVQPWDEPSRTITGSDRVGSGALCIADPRCGLDRVKGDHYLTGGQYGVVPWDVPSYAVSGAAQHDSGPWNVADPRMPAANDNLCAIIRALDNTWHRPFTTLELACLQSLIEPEELHVAPVDFDGKSEARKREAIGNAVPPAAAQAIADVMGQTLLMAWTEQTFALSATPIWVRDIAVALSVDVPVEGTW